MFKLKSKYLLSSSQKETIEKLKKRINQNFKYSTLLGVTGSGKTFCMANLIKETQKSSLVIAHNKTLAMQLYFEFKNLFPNNNVEYFVSNFDFYQPEAYLPKTNQYIEKISQINDELEMMRMSALNSLVTNQKTIVVASVAAIYASFSPKEFIKQFI